VPDGVTGLDKASVESWYETTILGNWEPNGGWNAADADEQEQAFIKTSVDDYFTSISLTTTNLATVFEIDDQWVTIEKTTDDNATVTGIVVRTRSESIGTETEREERYETDNINTAEEKLTADTPDKWIERSMTFSDNADGGYSMIQAVTSSDGEDMIRIETFNEDGTTTITIKGDVMFEGMLVQNAEITEQLDQYWNHTDFSGTSEIPNDMLQQLAPLNITIDNTKVLISFDGIGDYGQPKLTFTIFSTEEIVDPYGNVTPADTILTDPITSKPMVMTNYTAEGDSTLNEYALVDGDSYSTSRKDWVWNQDTFTLDSTTVDNTDADNAITTYVSTFTGTQSDKPQHTITVVETRKVNEDGGVNWLDHAITTTKDENYTINFKVIDRNNTDYDRREGVELEFVGTKEYMGDLYNNVEVFKFIDMHTGDVSINGSATSLDGSAVEIFKPEDQRKLEVLKIGRDGQQQKITEERDDDQDDHGFVEMSNEVYQWKYIDHNDVEWTVIDKYDGTTWSKTETSSAGERSSTESWNESTGASTYVFIEKLTGEDTYTKTGSATFDYTGGVFSDTETIVATRGDTEVANYQQVTTFNADYTSSQTTTGVLYEFNGILIANINFTETKNANWETTAVTDNGGATSDGASVTVSFTAGNIDSMGDPILDFAIGGAAAVSDSSKIANANNPVADDDAFTIDENATTVFDVIKKDSETGTVGKDEDEDGDSLSIKSIGDASNGKTFLLNGEVAYTPDENYFGTDSFTYTVTDGKGGNSTATVNITVNDVNEAVVANNDTFTMEQDTLVTVLNLTANDTDGDNDTITVESIQKDSTSAVAKTFTTDNGGVVSIDLGVVSYKPADGFSGTDTFKYTINDGDDSDATTATATATVVVTALNKAPTTTADAVTLKEDASVQIDVLANDTDDADTGNLTIDSIGDASYGTVKLMMGYVFYTPNTDYTGADSFTYVAKDSEGAKTSGTVTLTVSARNDAPVATVDVVNIEQDSAALTIDILANDTDVESDTLSLIKVGDASHGTVTMDSGKVIYTPTATYSGADSFTYVVGDLDTDGTTIKSKTTGTVNVTVSETNLDPVTVDDVSTVIEDTTSNKLSVLSNDTDPNGDTLTLSSVSAASYGTATLAGNIANASPIADSITFLLAAGAELTLYSTSTGQKRKMALREFFISYKKTAIKDDEIIYSVHIPSDGDIKYSFEKSSKRFSVDIATVNSALGIKVSGGKIVSLSFSVGGVAPVPLYCEELEKEAKGMPLTVESMNKLAGMAYNKIKPISDIRGTGEYRKILVKNHLIKHFYKLFPEIF
jgi:hypothetical protein